MTEDTFFADLVGFGVEVDILPYARTVLQECPYQHDLSAQELAELTVVGARGKYIPVATQDRVAGRMLGSMIRQVVGRVSFEHHRKAQLLDPDLRTLRPYIELIADLHVCSHAAAKSGQFLSDDELEPLPLPQCWGGACYCSYKLSSIKDLQRAGRLQENGTAVPLPAVQATFSGIAEIEEDDLDDE